GAHAAGKRSSGVDHPDAGGPALRDAARLRPSLLRIGRHHWGMVLRQMLGRPAAGEERDRYLPYRLAGWGLLTCLLCAAGWLRLAGATWPGALLIVLMMTMLFLVVARIVAETGLPFVQMVVQIHRPWIFAMAE